MGSTTKVVGLYLTGVIVTLTAFALIKVGGHLFDINNNYQGNTYHACLEHAGSSDAQKCEYVLKDIKG